MFCRPGRAIARLRRTACVVGAAVMAPLQACSPALDWRQMRFDDWSLTAALPCRPDRHERRLQLARRTVAMEMAHCSAADHVFAVASVALDDPSQVAGVLDELAEAARRNVDGRVLADEAAGVAGMTPQPAARMRRLEGRRPDGVPVSAWSLVFAHGTRVFQVSVLGPVAGEAQTGPLRDSLAVLR